MRLPIAAALFAALLVPTSADAGTVALERTELVFRSDPGQLDDLVVMPAQGVMTFRAAGLVAGAGCGVEAADELRCPSAGVTGLRIIAGDRSDSIVVGGSLPLVVDLGPGDDALAAGGGGLDLQQTSVTVDAGPGNDDIEASTSSAAIVGGAGRDTLFINALWDAAGSFTLDSGAGDDVLDLLGRAPGTTLAAGEGDDRIRIAQEDGPAVAVTCGPGADQWVLGPQDDAGDGCAPRLAGITPRTVSRVFREGRLTGQASGAVTLRRRVPDQGSPREIIATGAFARRSGAPRVSLKPTNIGRRWLRRNPRLPVFVYVRTRNGGDRGHMTFASRIVARTRSAQRALIHRR